jgi:hypothetical protein
VAEINGANHNIMRQITITISDLVIIAFAVLGFILLVRILFPEPAPVIQVTVNLPESNPKELTAGDHAKGLLKIGWDKCVDRLLFWK